MSFSVVKWNSTHQKMGHIIDEYDPLLHKHFSTFEKFGSRTITAQEAFFSRDCTLTHKVNRQAELLPCSAELLNFQLNCDHPAIKTLLQYMVELQSEATQAKIEKEALETFVKEQSDAIFKEIAKNLYNTIKASPKLKKSIEQFQKETLSCENKELIEKLENESNYEKTEGSNLEQWTWVDGEKDTPNLNINIDKVELEELSRQILILERASLASGNQKKFYVEMETFRKETQSNPKYALGKTLYKTAKLTYQTIQGIYYIYTSIKSAAPTLLFIAPIILPISWISVVRTLITILACG